MSDELRAICFECGEPADHEHHVIPRVLGGTKTVALCEWHHGMVHDRSMVGHRRLVREGLDRARRAGKTLGRPKADGPTPAAVRKLRKLGRSWSEIADTLGCTIGMARRRTAEAYDACAHGLAFVGARGACVLCEVLP